jgi:hypothetical protein
MFRRLFLIYGVIVVVNRVFSVSVMFISSTSFLYSIILLTSLPDTFVS